MSNVLKFQDAVPAQFAQSPLATAAGHVSMYRKREFLPVNSGLIYQIGSSEEIEFSVGSTTDFMVPQDTYLQFDLVVSKTLDGTENDKLARLEEGGAHNLFRKMEQTDRSGRNICTIDRYDVWSNIMKQIYESPIHTKQNEYMSGDQLYNEPADPLFGQELRYCLLSASGSTTAGDPTVSGLTYTDNVDAAIGDKVRLVITSTNQIVHEGTITASTGSAIDIYPAPGFSESGTISVLVTERTPAATATGNYTGTAAAFVNESGANAYRINIRLMGGIFDLKQDFPLFLLDGFKIKLYLQRAFAAFNLISPEVTGSLSASKTCSYKIVNPRLFTGLRTPSSSVREQYFKLFNQGELNYAYNNYFTTRLDVDGTATSSDLNIKVSKSSVRKCFFVCRNQRAIQQTNSTNLLTDSYIYPSKTFIDAGLSSYQFKVGGREYPPRRVEVTDKMMTEVLAQLQLTFGIHDMSPSQMRLMASKWIKQNQNSNAVGECDQSHKAIFSIPFDTVNNDGMTGLQTKGQGTDSQIVCELRFNSAHDVNGTSSKRYFEFFYEYFTVLHLSPEGIIILD